jgi:hypothetical protein
MPASLTGETLERFIAWFLENPRMILLACFIHTALSEQNRKSASIQRLAARKLARRLRAACVDQAMELLHDMCTAFPEADTAEARHREI